MKPAYSQCGNPELNGNDVADEAADRSHAAREAAVRRACDVMGWDYHQSPAWMGILKAANGEAVAVSVEKLNQLVDAIHEASRKANAAQTLNSNQRQMVDQAEIEKGTLQIRVGNAIAELDQLADLLADSEDLPVGQTCAVRVLNEAIESLSGLSRSKGE
jgi:hypothetical protein